MVDLSDPRHLAFWHEAAATSRCLSHTRLAAIGCFDDTPEGAQFCADAVLDGRKTATSTLAETARAYRPGDLEIVTLFDGKPIALIEITHIDERAFSAIDTSFALAEGEETLEDWRRTHIRFYSHRLAQRGKSLTPETKLLRIFFRRTYP
ncbi:MAG: ASCH domain-containing protein [Pseudomonadota bacterium]